MRRLLISTGEVSGDLQGGLLVQALHDEAQSRGLELEVVALGGERMRKAGAQSGSRSAPSASTAPCHCQRVAHG